METKTYAVRGMHCEACKKTVREKLEALEGVDRAEISLGEETARVTLSSDVSIGDLNDALSGTEYVLDRVREPEEAEPVEKRPVDKKKDSKPAEEPKAPLHKRLWPLILIVGYLIVVPGLLALLGGEWTITAHMRQFMGGFFIAFSFFKLLDLRGFVSAYRGYDLVAAAFPPYAWFYPFIELTLGILYLAFATTSSVSAVLNGVVIVLMLVGLVGVVRAILRPGHVRCACLGTVLDLPMTWVTFTENAAMAGMAGFMLYHSLVPGA